MGGLSCRITTKRIKGRLIMGFLLGAFLFSNTGNPAMMTKGGTQFAELYYTLNCKDKILINIGNIISIEPGLDRRRKKKPRQITLIKTYSNMYYLCTPFKILLKNAKKAKSLK